MSSQLTDLLAEAQRRGFIGPGDLHPHLAHARGFADAIDHDVPGRVVDLGSGGGLPSLVLAELWSTTRFWLVEASQRRTTFLREAVSALAWESRVMVLHGRAEELGHDEQLRESMQLVTARGFGPPAVTAECASPFLAIGGQLAVSEPPELSSDDEAARWPDSGLAGLGLQTTRIGWVTCAHYAVFRQMSSCPERYPRRVGIPAKRPLF